MPIPIAPRANTNNVISRNVVKQFASDGFIPVIALEAFVEAGRTYQAYKRGGFDEARERITEEFSGAVFWLGGVTGLNWLFEKMGQKVLKLPNKEVNISSDKIRNPLQAFLKGEKTKDGYTISKQMMSKFKFTKVLASVLIANGFIGFVLPKINQAITRSYHKNKPQENANDASNVVITRPSMDLFTSNSESDKQNPSFGGMSLLSIANNLENNRNWKLLSVDAGTASGRAYSARNNDERVEILFRDLSSIYFYMFNMYNMNKWLNKAETGIASRLDPISAEFATTYLNSYIGEDGKVKAADFEKDVLGTDKPVPENIKAKCKENERISLKEFEEELSNTKGLKASDKKKYKELAQKMSKLQPELNGKAILTTSQVEDIFKGGYINDPEFLMEFYKTNFGNKFLDKYDFIAQKDIESLKTDLINYVQSITKEATKKSNGEITQELLRKVSNKNLKMNAINWGTGFVVSAAFLSTLIPKMQYMITKLRTGQDNFPGTAQYRQEN